MTADREALLALRERVGKASGADRDLDAAICEACGMQRNPKSPLFIRWLPGDDLYTAAPNVTASIDDALDLVERVLPGWSIGCRRSGLSEHADAEIWNPMTQPGLGSHEMFRASNNVSSAPLAILSALLSALSERPQP